MAQDNNVTPTLREVVDDAVEQRLMHVHTALEGVVKSYDADLQVVDVQSEVYAPFLQPDGTKTYQQLGVCFRCPVGFPGVAGGFRITFPIPEGTTGLIICTENPLDEWFEQGGEIEPFVHRRHHLSDAMFVPILRNKKGAFKDAGADALTMGLDGGVQVVVTRNTVELGGNPSNPPTDFVAMAEKVLDQLNALKGIFSSWTPIAEDGGASLKLLLTPFLQTWPASVAAEIVKAK